jgi:hypothetical protein
MSDIMTKLQAMHDKVLAGKQLSQVEARILVNEAMQDFDGPYWNDQDLNHGIVVDAVSRLLGHVEALNEGNSQPEEKHETPHDMSLRKAREYLSDRWDVNPVLLEGQEKIDYEIARAVFDREIAVEVNKDDDTETLIA